MRLPLICVGVVVLLIPVMVEAARKTPIESSQRAIHPLVNRSLHYSLTDEPPFVSFNIPYFPVGVSYPEWTHHGVQYDVEVILENYGNSDIIYSITIEEDTSPSGWLTHSGFDGILSPGLNNRDTGTVHMNTGGIVNEPGTTVALFGRLIFDSNLGSSPDTFSIDPLLVTDTLHPPGFDTVSTACLSLIVNNNGSAGLMGIGHVNMDYVNSGDCDTTADIYLYDASPVIGWIDGSDTIMNWSIFGTTSADPVGFVQLSNSENYTDGVHDIYTAIFATNDTSIILDRTWYAPLDGDSCNFIIQQLRLWSNDDTPHPGLTIGEVIDWDIPADTSTRNGSDFNDDQNLIYQYGAEYNQDDSTECQESDARFGGLALLGMMRKDSVYEGIYASADRRFWGAYTADNDTWVYPNPYGFDPGELYARMQVSGYELYNSPDPESTYVDLHTVMTYMHDYTLLPGETLIVYTVLMTVENGSVDQLLDYTDQGHTWYCEKFDPDSLTCKCCVYRGDVNGVTGPGGAVDVSDLTYLVAYFFSGGPEPGCFDAADFNGDGEININDLVGLIDCLFLGGCPPFPLC